MTEGGLSYPTVILLTGCIVVLTVLIRSGLERIGMPSLIGFLLLGFLMKAIDVYCFDLLGDSEHLFHFLAKLGLVVLLFRVGLESNLEGLLNQLGRASLIWVGDVAVTWVVGYSVSYYLIGFEWITSLIVGTAFTATSVGISVAVWRNANAVDTPHGELLIDIAEMDDISAVVLMALLFTIVPVLKEQTGDSLFFVVLQESSLFLLKLIIFGLFCFIFSRYVEKPITSVFKNLESPPDPMLVIVGIGFIIAAFAGLMGFSLAIGAFFGGLVFSRDPSAVKMEARFIPLYELFSPFFFLGIGLSMDPKTIAQALTLGATLLVAAIIGKVVADGTPVLLMEGWIPALLIGVSMVPRAEIAMVVMHKGLNLGDWAVPSQVFGAMVVVCLATCVLAPLVLKPILTRWPQKGEATC